MALPSPLLEFTTSPSNTQCIAIAGRRRYHLRLISLFLRCVAPNLGLATTPAKSLSHSNINSLHGTCGPLASPPSRATAWCATVGLPSTTSFFEQHRRQANDAMATFNSMPAMSAAAPNEAMSMNHGAPGQPMSMDHFDPDFSFDEAVL